MSSSIGCESASLSLEMFPGPCNPEEEARTPLSDWFGTVLGKGAVNLNPDPNSGRGGTFVEEFSD